MAEIIHADCVEAMQAMEPDSVDAIVCDPPYSLGFMSKPWDMQVDHQAWATEALRVLKPGGHLLAFGGTRTYHRLACAVEDAGFEIRDSLIWIYGSGFPKSLDVSKAIDRKRDDGPAIRAVTAFITEHRNGHSNQAIDAHYGFNGMAGHWTTQGDQAAVPTVAQWAELKALLDLPDDMDAEVWRLNGRKGQPGENWEKREKTGERRQRGMEPTTAAPFNSCSAEVETLTAPATPEAQHWQGWGTALKPSHEPIVVARKPLSGTVAQTVLEHGTGALNIDGCRIESGNDYHDLNVTQGNDFDPTSFNPRSEPSTFQPATGRWPPNLTLSHLPECNSTCAPGCPVAELDRQSGEVGSSRFFYVAKASRAERNAGLEGFEEPDTLRQRHWGNDPGSTFSKGRNPKTGERTERDIPLAKNHHPTVKPIALMRWLVRLVMPKGGTVLDPFTGSGSTGVAAVLEGFDFVGIEREAEYVALAEARVAFWAQFPGADVDKVLLSDARAREIEASGQLGLL